MGRLHAKRRDIVHCGILQRLDTCDLALRLVCQRFAPFDEYLDGMSGRMARRVGYQALLVNNKACAVDELAVFCRQTEGVRLCGGGRAASCEGERLQVVVHGGEEGECGDGDVYPEVAGHSGGGGGGDGRWEEGGAF